MNRLTDAFDQCYGQWTTYTSCLAQTGGGGDDTGTLALVAVAVVVVAIALLGLSRRGTRR